MKVVNIEAYFPEVKGNAFKSARGIGGNWPLALYRAAQGLAKLPGIKGHRISAAKFTVSIGNLPKEEE